MSTETETASIPEMRDDVGLYCFLNSDRPCGAECMAFVTNPIDSKTQELGHAQQHCNIISSIERVGRHLAVIGGVLARQARAAEVKEQDNVRAANAGSSPNPFPVKVR